MLTAILLMLVACSGPAPAAKRVAAQDFAFVLANPIGLLALDAKGQVVGLLAELPRDSAPAAPSLFPDGKAIVFSITLPPDPARGFGSDIWAVNLDGTELRPLVEHERDNVFYSAPLVDPTGTVLYVQRRAAIIKDGQYQGNEDSIERIDLRTKARTRLVEQAADPTLAPDGKTIVYVRWVEGQPAGLWRVGTDGRDSRAFFRIGDTWWWLQAPRFSPDGRQLIFSAAGHSARSLAPSRGTAHLGIPSDLFLTPVDGSSVKAIAPTGDDVVPAWSPDGAHVAFISAGSLQVVAIADGNARQLAKGDNFFFGDLVWVRR